MFKDPPLPEDRLLDCYQRSSGAHWGIGVAPEQRKYDLMRRLLEQHTTGRRVLDIGCSNGDLLASLGNQWQRFGVEPGAAAAATAAQRDITIVGKILDEVDPNAQKFDAITAVDVIEHIVDPRPFMERIAALLADDGTLLIVTGDSGAASWRWTGNTYWYCSLPEHTSFFCRQTVDWICEALGFSCVEYRRESHAPVTQRRRMVEITKNIGYKIGRSVRGLGIPRLRRLFVERGAPGWLSSRDHMFCLLKKRTTNPATHTTRSSS